MNEPPTSENTTHDPDEAPAEVQRLLRERRRLRAKLDKTDRELADRLCSGDVLTLPVTEESLELAGFERVGAHETTGDLLRMFASTATEHAHRNPDDADAQGTAAIVKAIEIAHEAGDPEFIKKLAAKADYYLGYDFVPRPPTREEQAKRLLNAVAHGLQWGWTAGQIAQRLIEQLRIAPDIAQHTSVPASAGGWRDTDAQADAVFKVEKLVAEKCESYDKKRKPYDAEAILKATLRALGCPDETAQNLYR